MLDHLGATVGDELRRKRLKEVGIDHDKPREMESSGEVLAIRKIAPCLAASRRVNHRKKRSRNIDPGDAAHPGSGGETGQIACYAAAKRNKCVLAAKPLFCERMPEARDSRRSLVLLSRWNGRKRRDTKPTGPEPRDRLVSNYVAPRENCWRDATADYDERRLRVEERGDTVRERRVMRGAFLGLVAERPRPRRRADTTCEFFV